MKRLSLILLAAFGISLAVAPVQKEKEIEPTFFLASALSPYDEPKYLNNGAYYSDKGTFTQKETTYDRMGLGTTWDSVRGNKVKVAVIDTGLKSSHQDFNGTNISTHSYNVYGSNANYEDVNASIHGSVSASCIAAAINGVGGVGIAPDVELYIYRTCDANSGFTGTYLKKALRRAIDDHVDVINMSIQGYTETFTETYVEDWDGLTYTVNGSNNGLYKSTLQDLITEAYNAGITVVAAAGNYNTDRTCFPAANDYVIGVGSTGLNDNDAKAGYSNYGSYVDVCAPGYVVAPHPQSDSSYCVTYGTSFSAPLVSGAIALYKSKYPSATPAQIEARLKATCDPLNYTGSGSGRVNVANFLNNGPAETWIDASGMELPASADVAVGSSVKLTPTFIPNNTTRQTCYWSSSDETIATVDCYGNVTGKKQGSVTITATSIDGGFVDTCVINVGDYIAVQSVELSSSSVQIYEGKTHQLTWTLTPINPTDDTVVFFSDDESVATVTDDGLITGVAPGSTTITIMSTDGPTDTCTVTVNETPKETLVIKRSSFSNSGGYAWYDWTQTTSSNISVSGKGELYTTTTTSMQFNKSNGNNVAALFNTTAIPGSITKISAKTSSGTNRSWAAYVTSTSCSASGSTLTFGSNKTQLGTNKTIGTSQTDFGTTNTGYSYFCVQEGETGASYIENFTITYIPKDISSIAVKTAPTKLAYESGETFDPTGLVITVTYSDSTTADISYASSSSSFSFTPSTTTALTTSNTSVTISYGGKTCSQAITVTAAKTLSSISISGQTTIFIEGDTFGFGGSVTAHYSDGDSGDVTASATFTGYNMTTVGNQTVTVSYTYKGKTETATYSINVGAGTLSSIAVSGQTTVYQKNSAFSFDGTCTATFENGYQKTVTPSNVTSPDMSTGGVKEVTVSYTYNGTTKTASYNITVNAYRDVYESTTVSTYCIYDFTKLTNGSDLDKDTVQTSYSSAGGITGATVSSCSKVYVSSKLLRLGTSSAGGNIVFNFGTTKITNIKIIAKGWSSTENNCTMSITNGGTVTTTSDTQLDTFNVALSSETSSITLSVSKNNRIQIQSVTFYHSSTEVQNIGQSDDCIGLETFITNCLHMDYTDNLGYCNDNEHHYYETAKAAFNQLNDHQRSLFTGNEAYSLEWERLSTWASINGDYLDSNNKLVNTANVINAINNTASNEAVLVVLIISILLIPLGLYFFKRKEQ